MKRSKVLLTAAAISGMLLPTLVSAVPLRHIERAYYSDATLTEEVGYSVTPCVGYPYLYGERTDYSVLVVSEACD